MADELPQSILDQMPSELQVKVASLSEEGQQQVVDALTEAEAEYGLDHETIDEAVRNAEDADFHRENVENLQAEQAEAADAGDYGKAQDLANRAEYELREVESLGGTEATEGVIRAQSDEAHLESAQSNEDHAQDLADFAASGRGTDAANEAAAEDAADYQQRADEEGDLGDQGGVHGDHDYSADSATEDPGYDDGSE